jgi:hypothetical protein
MPVAWDDDVEQILGGDLTAALGYRTPAGGVVVQAIAPIGLHDRSRGTVGFTTSLGFSRKLDRIAADPRVALAFHAREHGTAHGEAFVLAQGRARVIERPSPDQRERMRANSAERLGPHRGGRFWDYWMREYYAARVPVEVDVERIVAWPDLRCAGEPRVFGTPLPEPPPPQRPPRKGTSPRLDVARARRRLAGVPHTLLGFAGADGFPVVLPAAVTGAVHGGLTLTAPALPPGARRAGLLGHRYRPQLVGLETRGYTGWLEADAHGRAVYAPHTESGYRAPPNKTLLLLLNGALAKRGVRRR